MAERVLDVEGLRAGYGRKEVVFGVDLHVEAGEIVTLMGHNGAGKSTTLRTVLGTLPARGGRISLDGADVTSASSKQNVARGMALVPSERFVFPDLSVHDNLMLGLGALRDKDERRRRIDEVHELFPLLAEREAQLAGTMSGGQQRMLSLGVLLSTNPKLLMLDEPSLGLAPTIVEQIFGVVRRLADEQGLAVLLVEQNVPASLSITDRVYGIRNGRIFLDESVDEMRARDTYWDLF
jgi:branched-chain amino acid transport system ATP-binding protein